MTSSYCKKENFDSLAKYRNNILKTDSSSCPYLDIFLNMGELSVDSTPMESQPTATSLEATFRKVLVNVEFGSHQS